MSHSLPRTPLVDALKALASQFIVLHHLAAYGPMSEFGSEHAAGLFDWLYCNARMAVQVFFVVGGFLAARTLAPKGVAAFSSPSAVLWRRYCRLAVPYIAAILLSIAVAGVTRDWMDHDFVPAAPTLAQFAAHAVLLHDILRFESLSAGVWYVAIDFQLFALLVAVLCLGRIAHGTKPAMQWAIPLLVLGLAIASLFYFNRDPDWDACALYFMASYGLGILAYWTVNRTLSPFWLVVLVVLAVLSVAMDFRPRLLVALTAALVLAMASGTRTFEHWRPAPWLSFLGRISYSVFLVHFPVCILVNAVVFRYFQADPAANIVGLLVAWASSISAGWLLYEMVERRTMRVTGTDRSRSGTAAAPL
ncbi:MAG: acyltransferase [Betaproteobacteria bacterium]|nr:acyltransferase [Betaproteobacteria bacterium]